MDARLGYTYDVGIVNPNWTEVARSTEDRPLRCSVYKVFLSCLIYAVLYSVIHSCIAARGWLCTTTQSVPLTVVSAVIDRCLLWLTAVVSLTVTHGSCNMPMSCLWYIMWSINKTNLTTMCTVLSLCCPWLCLLTTDRTSLTGSMLWVHSTVCNELHRSLNPTPLFTDVHSCCLSHSSW